MEGQSERATRDWGPESDAARAADAGLERMYAGSWAPMVRLATMLLGDQSRAEDIVQDALIALHRRWGQLTHEGDPTAYLRKSVVNGVRSAQRHQGVVDRQIRADAADPTQTAAAPGADHVVIRHAEQDQLLAALDTLSSRQREVLTLRYWGDLSETEIADALGISPGSVKTHAHRALAALAERREELS